MDCKYTSNNIVNWMDHYLRKSGQKGFVVGVSGGVDSAVVSTLCAMTGKPVSCLILPIHQAEAHTSRGVEHANQLKIRFDNISLRVLDLTEPSDSLKNTIGCFVTGLIEANLRSRLRMTALYAFANNNHYLVAGTGNLIEDKKLGFFTKGGDGMVDLSPIGHLTKTQVFELAAYLKVPQSILKAKPTDGLWSDDKHSDEDQLGNTYPELEQAIKFCEDLKIEDTSTYNYAIKHHLIEVKPESEKVILNYLRRHAASSHKMRMPPVGPAPT